VSLYQIRTVGEGYRIIVFDDGLNVLRYYHMHRTRDGWSCGCPQQQMSTCRHRIMLWKFQQAKRIDTGWFYDYDAEAWKPPITFWSRLKVRS
jgi:hypothetical protein